MRINFVPDTFGYMPPVYTWASYFQQSEPSILGAGNLGLDNNNPGNIRYNENIKWQGQVGQNHGFAVFASMAWGYRALMRNLQAYISDGHDTVRKIITRWAPPSDGNNTASYIKHVSERTGYSPDQVIDVNDLAKLSKIAGAISISEIGTMFPSEISKAVEMLSTGAVAPSASGTPAPQPGKPKVDTKLIVKGASILAFILTIDKFIPDDFSRSKTIGG